MNYDRETLNKDYFEVIDTENKAYFLGLLFADGSVTIPKGNRQKVISLSLQEDDSEVVTLLNKEITPYKKMTIQRPTSIIKRGWKARATFSVGCDKLVNDLMNHGCINNKTTLGLGIPNLKTPFLKHFIRGYFDGNGGLSVKITKNTYKRVSNNNIKSPFKENKLRGSLYFCSTDLDFLNYIKNILNSSCKIIGTVQLYDKKTLNCLTRQIRYEHKEDIKEIFNYLYKDSKVFLKRKNEKFKMLIKSEAINTFIERLETT